MAIVRNEITINAGPEKIWNILSDLECLAKYDPTVKKSTLIAGEKAGIGAKRKVDMVDGKNWFEEKITVFDPQKTLTYELTDCSFPMQKLKHSYSFESNGSQTKVIQIMDYTVKFALLGKLLDYIMIRKQTNAGIKKFFSGLKQFAEKN